MVRVGTSGWHYDEWRGAFYPHDLPAERWFDHYAARFDTVEINATFYNLPDEGTVERWRDQAPEGFLYAVKYSRYGTHMKKLKDPDRHVPAFLQRYRLLGNPAGPVLVQLPPRWHAAPARLDAFLAAMPEEVTVAVEVRDPTWLCDEVYAVLAAHHAALCWHDAIANHPHVSTAGFAYLRFHGDGYAGTYGRDRLADVAGRIRAWRAEGRDVYAYFNNTLGGAVGDAHTLRALTAP